MVKRLVNKQMDKCVIEYNDKIYTDKHEYHITIFIVFCFIAALIFIFSIKDYYSISAQVVEVNNSEHFIVFEDDQQMLWGYIPESVYPEYEVGQHVCLIFDNNKSKENRKDDKIVWINN